MDDDLDLLLRGSAPVPPTGADVAAVALAREVRGRGAVTSRAVPRRSRLRLAAAVAGGALLLSGAGTLAAYQLSIPPFQTVPAGVQRATDGVAITYTDTEGRDLECLVFVETSNVGPRGLAAVDRIAADPRWATFGDEVLRRTPGADPAAQQEAVFDAADLELRRATQVAVPGILMDPDEARERPDDPAFAGTAMSCDVTGRPR